MKTETPINHYGLSNREKKSQYKKKALPDEKLQRQPDKSGSISFQVEESWDPKGKWASLDGGAEAGIRVYMTCLSCHRRYPVVHPFCGSHLPISIAVKECSKCAVCWANGQTRDASVSPGTADCPGCGSKCRSSDQVRWAGKGPLPSY